MIAGPASAENVTGRLVILGGVYPREVSTRVFQNWLECKAPGGPALDVAKFFDQPLITPGDMERITRINGLGSAEDLTNFLRGTIARNIVEHNNCRQLARTLVAIGKVVVEKKGKAPKIKRDTPHGPSRPEPEPDPGPGDPPGKPEDPPGKPEDPGEPEDSPGKPEDPGKPDDRGKARIHPRTPSARLPTFIEDRKISAKELGAESTSLGRFAGSLETRLLKSDDGRTFVTVVLPNGLMLEPVPFGDSAPGDRAVLGREAVAAIVDRLSNIGDFANRFAEQINVQRAFDASLASEMTLQIALSEAASLGTRQPNREVLRRRVISSIRNYARSLGKLPVNLPRRRAK